LAKFVLLNRELFLDDLLLWDWGFQSNLFLTLDGELFNWQNSLTLDGELLLDDSLSLDGPAANW
jgi:hypothetical protein